MIHTLLIEIFTEELPPKALTKLGDAFATGIFNGLKARDFLDDGALATAFTTPRRLAVAISNVRATSLDKTMREKVLPVSVALDAEGKATAPLVKKLAALGDDHVAEQPPQSLFFGTVPEAFTIGLILECGIAFL